MKFIKLLLILILVTFSCAACTTESAYDKGYEEGYDAGVSDGRDIGEELAKEYIYITYEFDIDTHEMEDVRAILRCYADENSGEDISEEDLRDAIWKILEYYDKVDRYLYNISK